MGYQSGVEITRISATPEHDLGFELTRLDPTDADRGLQKWIYVQMTGAAAAVGSVCSRTLTGATRTVVRAPVATPASAVVGVAQHAITQDYYGFILREGVGEVLAGTGTIDASEAIMVDLTTAGTATEPDAVATAQATTGTEHGTGGHFGWALEDAAATALATCWISCRG